MEARWKKRSSRPGLSLHWVDQDLICSIFVHLDPFDLGRCCVVCKSWKEIIYNSNLLKDLYYSKRLQNTHMSNAPSFLNSSLKNYLADFALEQHRLSLISNSVEVHQWNAHSVGVSQCIMKMGLIVTGVGDKVLRLWSVDNCKCMEEYPVPHTNPLIDFDFDESKIVGLIGTRICIWRRHGKRSMFPSKDATFTRGLCMRYMDPEAAVGCGDGSVRIFDMYSQSCSRIIKMHQGSISCLDLTDDQMLVSGCSLGSISITSLSCDQEVALLKSSSAPTGIRTLCFNPNSHQVFAGSTDGYAHSWDLRTMRLLWETRISPNVLYSMQHMSTDTSALVVGGVDGILRILNQSTGEILASYVLDKNSRDSFASDSRSGLVKKKATKLSEDYKVDNVPWYIKPPISCVAVGMKKVVTAHNGRFFRMWKFNK